MQKSYESGVATHIGPESCGAAREGGAEALTGECAGRVFSREIETSGCRRCKEKRKAHRAHRYREVCQSPARSETPCTHADTSRGNREVPGLPRTELVRGRIGKSKDARR